MLYIFAICTFALSYCRVAKKAVSLQQNSVVAKMYNNKSITI